MKTQAVQQQVWKKQADRLAGNDAVLLPQIADITD
jgi:hypothetical protein